MMADTYLSLETLAPGFADPVHDSQAVFRVLLDALARPGSTRAIEVALGDSDALANGPSAALAALLTLCDYATPVWLQRRDDALASTIRFHTGAPLVDAPDQAAFAYIDDAAALPSPEAFPLGDPAAPERSATLLIRVDAFEGGRPLKLTGPGIETVAMIAPVGIDDTFWTARAALATVLPCGIDCYLVCGRAVMGIPRTTRVELD
jgi:alpha-D-ribose 1-methylphosphonate 5-triphosphate synthase subunit PhnH